MEKLYSEAIALRAPYCDIHGEWRPGAILETMQETAGEHCERLNLGRPVMDGLGVAWVLTRTRVELKQVPRMGEIITAQTWPLPPKHLFFPRVNAFLDSNGAPIGEASSLWVLMDLRTRRIVNNATVLERLPDNADMPAGLPLGAFRPLEGTPETAELIPPYSDFDLNGHVNNTKYLDWACNALGHSALAERRVRAFSVSYDAEVLPGPTLRTELVCSDDQFSFCGYDGDRRCFCIVGTLEDRR